MDIDSVGLDQETLTLRETLRDVVNNEIAPHARAIDEQGIFPSEAMKLLAQMGILGILIPEEYGGTGGTKLQYVIAVEELARGCGSTSLTFMTQAHGSMPILIGGSEEQKTQWLPRIAGGELLTGIALSEPHAGSDLSSAKTTAKREGDHYVVDGSKIFITNGGHADTICTFLSTDPSAGAKGLSALIVDMSDPGVEAGPPLAKMGMRGSDTVELFFGGVRVPVASRIGDEGDGFSVAMETLDGARLSTAAQALGIAQGAYDLAFRYAQEREQFGHPIYHHQAVQFRLVDMHIQIQAVRAATYRVATLLDADPAGRHSRETATVKVMASDVAMRATTDAVQTLGGYGYMREYEAERMMRDAKVTQIYDGTNDINRLVIGRELIRSMS